MNRLLLILSMRGSGSANPIRLVGNSLHKFQPFPTVIFRGVCNNERHMEVSQEVNDQAKAGIKDRGIPKYHRDVVHLACLYPTCLSLFPFLSTFDSFIYPFIYPI